MAISKVKLITLGVASTVWLSQVGASFEVARAGVTLILLLLFSLIFSDYLIEQAKVGKYSEGILLIHVAAAILLLGLIALGIYIGW